MLFSKEIVKHNVSVDRPGDMNFKGGCKHLLRRKAEAPLAQTHLGGLSLQKRGGCDRFCK